MAAASSRSSRLSGNYFSSRAAESSAPEKSTVKSGALKRMNIVAAVMAIAAIVLGIFIPKIMGYMLCTVALLAATDLFRLGRALDKGEKEADEVLEKTIIFKPATELFAKVLEYIADKKV